MSKVYDTVAILVQVHSTKLSGRLQRWFSRAPAANAMPKMHPVNVTILGDDKKRALIEGGKLAPDCGWIADVTLSADNTPFVALRTKSSQLQKWVGSPIRSDDWLSRLTVGRNTASDAALVELAKSKGMYLNDGLKRNKWAKVVGGKKTVAALSDCPDVVMVPMMVHDADGDTVLQEIKCMFSAVDLFAPKVECTIETMVVVARSIAANFGGANALNRGQKRPRSD